MNRLIYLAIILTVTCGASYAELSGKERNLIDKIANKQVLTINEFQQLSKNMFNDVRGEDYKYTDIYIRGKLVDVKICDSDGRIGMNGLLLTTMITLEDVDSFFSKSQINIMHGGGKLCKHIKQP